ncbi:MAG: 23S rRNA (pseudouridine(1915)-N(3))-methyltransferase RlmH [Bacilli bacterium]|nr:23S rRNA (pseudouridine(1915)-N(3))-methyltransferase RlmH [Bacilli bacterium]
MIKIICIGKIKEKYLREAIEDYVKRIKKYTNFEIIELKDENDQDIKKAIKVEGENILKYVNTKDYIITLEVKGEQLSSEKFAEKITKINIDYSNICFIIGGSNGLSEDVLKKKKFSLSFSKMTFPHQLFRVILLEQIYRAYKIKNNETYHK